MGCYRACQPSCRASQASSQHTFSTGTGLCSFPAPLEEQHAQKQARGGGQGQCMLRQDMVDGAHIEVSHGCCCHAHVLPTLGKWMEVLARMSR